MTLPTTLYFTSILLIGALTGFLAFYAWRQPALPGVRMYAWLVFSECLLALVDILSMLSGTQEQALFWFNLRFFFTAIIPVIFLVFALEYSGQKSWLSKKLLAGALVIPAITQVMLWSNSLHGLWVKQEVGFQRDGLLWIADTSARIPGLWFMLHSFYSLILLLAGIGVILLVAWRMRQIYHYQALLLCAGALVVLITAVVPIFNLLPQAGFTPFIPGIGISALLYALAILRFQFLKHFPTQEGAAQLTHLNAQGKRSLAVFLFTFILFASGIAAVSYMAYQNYEKQSHAQVESQLSAISLLKVNELQDWYNGFLVDASLFYQNDNFSELVQRYLEIPGDIDDQNRLAVWLEKIRVDPEIERVFLVDSEGHEQISSPVAPEPPDAYLLDRVAPTLASGQITMLDFHRDSAAGPIHLAILVPIFDHQNGSPLGILVLRINPEVTLYPFLQQWPVPSQSAETLLIRREGEAALFLNPLRFQPGAALNLRFPLGETEKPAVKAALGQKGIVEGLDYRGVQVIADVHAVPGSPWFLVAKIDAVEAYTPLRERLWQTTFLFGMLTLVAGAGLTQIWRQQRLHYYREQVDAAEALRASEEKFRLAFLTSPDSIAITRLADGMFISVNKGFEQITGYTIEETTGKSTLDINIWKDPEDRKKVIEGLQAKGEIRNYEAAFLTRNGEIYGLMSAALLELDGVAHILTITRDITERKRTEQLLAEHAEHLEERVETRTRELRAAQEKLVRQERLAVLGQLAGSVSHELRNPLGVISNAVYFLSQIQPDADAKVKEYLEIINSETCTATKIITDLLDFSHLKSVKRKPVAVADLVKRTLERFPVPTDVTVTLDLSEDLPEVYADPYQVVQVLGNLVVNACQAMPQGGQLVIRGQQSAASEHTFVSIRVQDSGAGIAPENMSKLFEPLFTTKPLGIGLGLAVCKNLAEANGGRIEVQSQVGEGSTFTLFVPSFKESL